MKTDNEHESQVRHELHKWFGDRVRLLDIEVEDDIVKVLGDKRLFGNVDVGNELKRAHVYELANPERRKESNELRRFLVGWCDRASQRSPEQIEKTALTEMHKFDRAIVKDWAMDMDWVKRVLQECLDSNQHFTDRIRRWLQRASRAGNLDIIGKSIHWRCVQMSAIVPSELAQYDFSPCSPEQEALYRKQLDEVLSRSMINECGDDSI